MGKLRKFIRLFISERQFLRIWYWLYGIKGNLYKGSARHCPVCEGNYSQFFPYGDVEKRNNAVCPHCRSMERQRLFWLYLKDNKEFIDRPIKMLHFAPEPILEKKFKALSTIDYLSADIDLNLAMQQEDIQALSFSDNTFDFILCSHVLAMVDDDKKAIAEMFRVTKPGGRVIIQERYDVDGPTVEDKSATSDVDRIRLYGKDYLQRLYGTDFHKRLEEAGFQVKVEKYMDQFNEDEKLKLGLGNKEEIYLAVKPSIKASSFDTF